MNTITEVKQYLSEIIQRIRHSNLAKRGGIIMVEGGGVRGIFMMKNSQKGQQGEM